jgi:hypothetical protein
VGISAIDLVNYIEHKVLPDSLITEDVLNDQRTSQPEGLLCQANTGQIPDTFLITPTQYARDINQFTREAVAPTVYTAHFRPSATGGPI